MLFRMMILGLLAMLLGCAQPAMLAQTPNVLKGRLHYPDADLSTLQRSTKPSIYFLTDRQPADTPTPEVGYTHERSHSMAFGRQQLSFGDGLDWDSLKVQSVSPKRTSVQIKALTSDELVRFPPTPIPYLGTAQNRSLDPATNNSYAKASAAFKAEIKRAVQQSPRREVLVYVHGIKNDFENGSGTIANLWHFSGRTSVPIMYTWPAGNPGILGYFSDRESSLFSIYHFKEFLRLLAEVPEVERINVVAHSQGTALTTSALREMIIAARAAGKNPKKSMKIENLILAAPDLNFDVFGQRLIAERFDSAFHQVVIYTSGKDRALGLAQRFMSGVRVGRVGYDDLDVIDRRVLKGIDNLHFVNVEAVVGRDSHSYFHRNPDVLSDVIITLRTGEFPGGTERPLEPAKGIFWTLHPGYPFDRPTRVFDVELPSR